MSETASSEQTHFAAPPASPRQVLLGIFVLFQLAFLIISNMLSFVTWIPTEVKGQTNARINQLLPHFADERGHGWSWSEQVETNLRRWVQLTGQDQDWALFAPGVAKATGFPVVVLLWDPVQPEQRSFKGAMMAFDHKNGFNLCADWNPSPSSTASLTFARQAVLLSASSPLELLGLMMAGRQEREDTFARLEFVRSENEPSDMSDFIRLGKCRVRRYEGQLYLNSQPYENETQEEFASRMSRRMRQFIRDYHDPALEYLRWRLISWQQQHPNESAPKQVILFERFYRIHGPDELRGWDGPMLIPLARWQTEAPRHENIYLLEPFDFTDQCFLTINR